MQTPELVPAPPIPPVMEALVQDAQARASTIQRAQLNGSILASNPNAAPGPLNTTNPISVVAVNQSALNSSALNANQAALNNSALNRSTLSNQPSRQAVVNTSVHNRTAYNNNLANPIVLDSAPVGPLTGPVQQPISSYPSRMTVAQKELSGKLTLVFWLGVLLMLVEMFVMLGRYHFIAMMAALAVLSLFILNLFGNNYNKFLLVVLLVSMCFDVAWLVVKLRRETYPDFYSTFAELHIAVNTLVVILVFVSLLIRFVLFVLLCGFREVAPDRNYFIVVMGNEIVLNDAPGVHMGGYEANQIIYHPV